MDDDLVPYKITEHQLEIRKSVVTGRCPYRPRDGDKGDAGQRCPDHPEGDQIPRRLPACDEERLVVLRTSGTPGYEDQHTEVGDDETEDEVGRQG